MKPHNMHGKMVNVGRAYFSTASGKSEQILACCRPRRYAFGSEKQPLYLSRVSLYMLLTKTLLPRWRYVHTVIGRVETSFYIFKLYPGGFT